MLDRWKLAQKAEVEHNSHSGIPPNTDWTQNWLNSQLSLSLDYLHDKNILEVGCGTGMVHTFDFECNNIGVDPLALDFKKETEGSTAEVINAMGENLPFCHGCFDIVIYYNVLDHTKYPKRTLEECYRVIDNGGDLLLSVNTFDRNKLIRKLANYVDPPHPCHFSNKEVKKLLEKSGFSPISENTKYIDGPGFKGQVAKYLFGLQQYNSHWVV